MSILPTGTQLGRFTPDGVAGVMTQSLAVHAADQVLARSAAVPRPGRRMWARNIHMSPISASARPDAASVVATLFASTRSKES